MGAFAAMSLVAARPDWVRRCVFQEPWDGTVSPSHLAPFAALKREPREIVVKSLRGLFPTRPHWAIAKLARALCGTADGVFELEQATMDLRTIMRTCRPPTLILRADPNLGGAM